MPIERYDQVQKECCQCRKQESASRYIVGIFRKAVSTAFRFKGTNNFEDRT